MACEKCDRHRRLWYELAVILDHPGAEEGDYVLPELLEMVREVKRRAEESVQAREHALADMEAVIASFEQNL